MGTRLVKRLTWLVVLIIAAASASAANMTLDQLIESYNYDFYGGDINVTLFDDYMLDKDGNGLNDTLTINLTTNASGASTYLFIVSLNGEASLIKNYTNKTVSSSDKSAQVSFGTRRLSLKQYNYSAEVRRQDYSLAYAKYKVQTDYYQTYEQGISITSVSDQAVNNDALRITLNLNVTENKTANITAYLKYSNQTISASKEVTLATPSQLVNIDFDNETIKSTHYDGVYSLESIRVGDKVLDVDYNTSSYDYKTFAKTSYIRNVTSVTFDNSSNNLSDALQFNFTLNITSADTYTLEAALYTSDDKYVTSIAKNVTLAAGMQTVSTEVIGKTIYATYHNGQFKLSFAKLSIGNSTKDIIYDAHATNATSYADFERPPLPDLAIAINTSFTAANNVTSITVNVTNLGSVPAFNVVVDIFDNVTYENRSALSFLNVSESRLVNFSAANTTNNSLFIAVADFDNLVDESNESNNVADNVIPPIVVVSLKITSLSQLYSNGTNKVFEFVMENNGISAVNNVTWKLSLGDGTVINSTLNTSLTVGEKMLVYADYNYSSEGSYTVTANATAIGQGASVMQTLEISVGALSVSNFSVLNSSGTERTFEAYVKNYMAVAMSNVSWSLNTGNGIMSSTSPITLQPQEVAFVFVHYNYTSTGTFAANFTAVNGSWNDLEALNVTIA